MKYAGLFVALVFAGACGSGGGPIEPSVASGFQDGKTLYTLNCAVCHGDLGRGDGPAATFLFPKPRDFTRGSYKIRTTAGGELPTDEDLLRSVTEGLPGSGMPSFAHLSDAERLALVRYIKAFAVVEIDGQLRNQFEVRDKPRVIKVPSPPKQTAEMLARGKDLYRSKGCVACHGERGLGDGPSALTLADDLGMPIRPNNFRRGIYKGGGSVEDIYLRFTTGMNGTPMPSFEETLKDEERWALAYFVQSLAGEKVSKQTYETTVIAKRITASFPLDPDDPVYLRETSTEIPLMALWQRQELVESIRVRAYHNGQQLAVLLEWDDATVNGRFIRPQDFSDGVAVQFPLRGERPSFTMGDKEHPVNVWHWRMDWQIDVARFHDMEDSYPGMVADDYLFERPHYPKSIDKPGHQPVRPAPSHDPTFLAGWGAGNLQSDPNRKTPCHSMIARGFGSLEALPKHEQTLVGRGYWHDGQWRVLIVRDLKTSSHQEAQFQPGQQTFAAFAVWDGAKGDRDGQKMVTYWQKFALEK